MHFGAVVSDAPSPLSTPRTRIQGKPRCDWVNLCALRQGKPRRYQARRKSSRRKFGIVRATVPFQGEHDALEPRTFAVWNTPNH